MVMMEEEEETLTTRLWDQGLTNYRGYTLDESACLCSAVLGSTIFPNAYGFVIVSVSSGSLIRGGKDYERVKSLGILGMKTFNDMSGSKETIVQILALKSNHSEPVWKLCQPVSCENARVRKTRRLVQEEYSQYGRP